MFGFMFDDEDTALGDGLALDVDRNPLAHSSAGDNASYGESPVGLVEEFIHTEQARGGGGTGLWNFVAGLFSPEESSSGWDDARSFLCNPSAPNLDPNRAPRDNHDGSTQGSHARAGGAPLAQEPLPDLATEDWSPMCPAPSTSGEVDMVDDLPGLAMPPAVGSAIGYTSASFNQQANIPPSDILIGEEFVQLHPRLRSTSNSDCDSPTLLDCATGEANLTFDVTCRGLPASLDATEMIELYKDALEEIDEEPVSSLRGMTGSKSIDSLSAMLNSGLLTSSTEQIVDQDDSPPSSIIAPRIRGATPGCTSLATRVLAPSL